MYLKNRTYNTYRPNTRTVEPPRKSFQLLHIKWLLLLALIVGISVHFELARRAEAQAAAASEAAYQQTLNTDFKKSVKAIVNNNPLVSVSVAVVASVHPATEVIGDTNAEDAASTTKLITAIAYLHKVEKGQTSLNYPVNDQPASTELRLLINQSDDQAWAAFNDKLGHAYLQSYADSLGLQSYSADDNLISSADLAKLADRLGSGKLLSSAHTKLLLSYMQQTNLEDFIPPATLPGAKLYHKVGIDGDQVNDVAIITGRQKSLVLCIFTNGHGSYDWQARAKLMQDIAVAAQKAYL